jgi:hypothetical protein
VPAKPGTSQASHCPPQLLSQQIPSMQLFELHWTALWHESPLGFFGWQAPLLQ